MERMLYMGMSAMVISIVLTIVVLLLTLLTISQGYGYKHTIDPPVNKGEHDNDNNDYQESKAK